MTDTPLTPAQEAISTAMFVALLGCTVVSYFAIKFTGVADPIGYLVLAVATFIVSGYIVPNLTASWIGRPLDMIMDGETTHPRAPDDLAH